MYLQCKVCISISFNAFRSRLSYILSKTASECKIPFFSGILWPIPNLNDDICEKKLAETQRSFQASISSEVRRWLLCSLHGVILSCERLRIVISQGGKISSVSSKAPRKRHSCWVPKGIGGRLANLHFGESLVLVIGIFAKIPFN